MGFRISLLTVVSMLLAGCLSASGPETSQAQLAHVRCSTPSGVSGSPRSIFEAMTLLNALPKPTSVACFLESLDRPLRVIATSNQVNAQPADGSRSPRVFIVNSGLILSVVPAGIGANRVEMSESAPYAQSVKGEVLFPVLSVLPTSAPYTVIRYGAGTSCTSCHSSESRITDDATHIQAFASNVRYPDPTLEVSTQELLYHARTCDPRSEPDRCAILSAIVGPDGDITRGTY